MQRNAEGLPCLGQQQACLRHGLSESGTRMDFSSAGVRFTEPPNAKDRHKTEGLGKQPCPLELNRQNNASLAGVCPPKPGAPGSWWYHSQRPGCGSNANGQQSMRGQAKHGPPQEGTKHSHTHHTAWMDLEKAVLGERSQPPKATCHV